MDAIERAQDEVFGRAEINRLRHSLTEKDGELAVMTKRWLDERVLFCPNGHAVAPDGSAEPKCGACEEQDDLWHEVVAALAQYGDHAAECRVQAGAILCDCGYADIVRTTPADIKSLKAERDAARERVRALEGAADRADVVEAVARAIFDEAQRQQNDTTEWDDPAIDAETAHGYRCEAREAIKALINLTTPTPERRGE